ncbi:uncharacterized protein LOC124289709 [Haliotis rubra]|uniref:uncharacterized protein LOC124289709 n=1 Tax=Haliotis rubra TaxID=36100 RepID=UPI001EE4EBEA|nr:uncharacterized protein LOC124289709 [Haliotis rubra]XP_046582294.1 uncharacterized protein LOC124289709 [Haliotis rubra]XP_046582295.1 uncharacterized protein LOC124289709 [Haliotis rubra]
MATASSFQDDFLTCSICYDVYTIPKSLPCLHTFCLKCLSSYIVAEDENFGVKRKKGFPCPLCRELIEAPCSSKPLEEWASDFKTNFYIENLMNALKVKESESQQLTIVNILSNVSSKQSPDAPASMDLSCQATNSNRSGNLSSIPSITSDERRRFETGMTKNSSVPTLNPLTPETVNISHLACMPYQRRFHLLKDLSGEMQDDNTKVQLSAICVVGGVIAVLDFGNQSLKTFSNLNEHDVKMQSLHLAGKPKSVTNVLDSFVAVTVPCLKSIYIISIQSELEVVSVLRTERCYKSIHDSGSGTFIAVTCQIRQNENDILGPIDIINHEGKRLSSLRICRELIRHDFTNISVSPSGLIHLIDSTAHSLVCLTQYGHELFRYAPENEEENFLSQNGLCCRTGDIYVTHFEANSVFVIKCDGGLPILQKKIVSISDGVKQPMDVHVEPDGTVFVACWDGFVRVYSSGAQPSILKKHMETAVTPTSMDLPSQATNSNRSRNITTSSVTSDERRRFETGMTKNSSVPTLYPLTPETVNISHLACMPYQRRFHLLKDLSGEMQDDNTKVQLSAICVVGGVVAVLDFGNQSLKTFSNWNEHDVKMQSLHLAGKPKSVTNVLDSFVAVTVPCLKSIYIISIQSELEVVSVLRTERCYKSIHDSGSGTFIAVTCQIHQNETLNGDILGPIDIINHEGKSLSSLRICRELIQHDFTNISMSPSGLIHLVDSTAHALVCLTQYGHELFRYAPENEEENFLSQNGLCCRTGDIYVTHFEANSVFVIKCDGGLPVVQEKIVSISDGVKQPMDVHVEPDGTVFVACWDGFVRVYTAGAQPAIVKKHMETAV